ncbi:hypothetical protein [Gulosibacter sp. 10]|uniref:hypothetical protein n=1 Tax=Gulosibacter sp. 10 TaxID=1255570 RepID=UPI00097EF06D|nr:hypothetical protein [Gulosibacter sp. 10]SJM62630.1 hypothetical protein FM112_08650 [Gulosibacter sp. 10]
MLRQVRTPSDHSSGYEPGLPIRDAWHGVVQACTAVTVEAVEGRHTMIALELERGGPR